MEFPTDFNHRFRSSLFEVLFYRFFASFRELEGELVLLTALVVPY